MEAPPPPPQAPAPPAAQPPLAPPAGAPAVGLVPARASPGLAAARGLLASAGVGIAALALLDAAATGLAAASGLAGLLALLALAAALLAAALRPAELARRLRAPGLPTPAGLAAFALVAFALYLVFGVGTIVDTARLLELVLAGRSTEEVLGSIDRRRLLLNVAVNFLVFTVPVVAWVAAAEGRGRGALARWLGLTRDGARASLAWAAISVLLVFWFLVAVGLGSRALGAGEPENERALAIARSLDVPLAVLVSALTGLGEEVFFRGLLLRKIGNAPQAALFGLAHLNYLQALEVAVTAALGFLFGRVVERTRSLWGPVVAHAAFNAVILVNAIEQTGAAPA